MPTIRAALDYSLKLQSKILRAFCCCLLQSSMIAFSNAEDSLSTYKDEATTTSSSEAEIVASPNEKLIDFNYEIRPILSDYCFQCHGPDPKQRQGELRLDLHEYATQPSESGAIAIVPGNSLKSELVRRIQTSDDADRMPPLASNKQLTQEQKALLVNWIDQGAVYKQHWAFVPPVRLAVPVIDRKEEADFQVQNEIDAFVMARLRREGLTLSPEADKPTLIRRVTFDLTGLPPTVDEVIAFMHDDSPKAYNKVVERLLASPRYGEHMGRFWLDVARYADTNGYQVDLDRTMWPWRDWVINAYNRNMPFDQFTIEQLAGDLISNPTKEQLIATGFNRNHCVTMEGGVIDEEYRVEYVMDRVTTTATTWLGVTMSCCRCHDHKYDPFSQRDFYQLFAFFNNVPEKGHIERTLAAEPRLTLPTDQQQVELKMLDDERSQINEELKKIGKTESNEQRKVLETQLATLDKKCAELKGQVLNVMIMRDAEQPRETFILNRGQYDQPGEKVIPDVPSTLSPLPPNSPRNRLGLARWLTHPAQPLTARVIVNRDWQKYFGKGLVKTSEDFGVQGDMPSHLELLDWLAAEFIQSGWNVKHIQRLIVTSATYRQASHIAAQMLQRDPDNRLLARGPRFRLSAEEIRDSALAASGLLSSKMGGPSVLPYQPEGLWTELNDREGFSMKFVQSHSEDLYRRSVYTFWKRTVPPPTMQVFDAPEREYCVVRRSSTNTPLQALVLLNDIQMVEAARKLAERMLVEGGDSWEEQLKYGFLLATARVPTGKEIEILRQAWQEQYTEFKSNTLATKKMLMVGESPVNETIDPIELATCAHIARLILNLDETITKH